MLAVVKTPRTSLKIEGEIPRPVLTVLKKQYGKKLILDESKDDEEYENVFETDWYKKVKKKMNPGTYLKIYRENKQWTQEQIGEKLGGLSRHYISDLENGHREISKEMAKKLSKFFKQPVALFI